MVISTLETVKNNTVKNFPVLGTYLTGDKLIILFTGINSGTVIYSELSSYTVGETYTGWDSEWVIYLGKVILANKNGLPITE